MPDPTMQEFANERVAIQVEINKLKVDRDSVLNDLRELQTNLAALQADKNTLAASLAELAASVSGAIASASETLASVREVMKSAATFITDVKSEIPGLIEQLETVEASLASTREVEKEVHEAIMRENAELADARNDLDVYRERLKADFAAADKVFLL